MKMKENPDIWADILNGLKMNEQLLTVIERCNLDKQAIREIEGNMLPPQNKRY